jgi:hypothetical protein
MSTTSGITAVPLLTAYETTTSLHVKEIYGKDHASFLLLVHHRVSALAMDDFLLVGQIADSKVPSADPTEERESAIGSALQHIARRTRANHAVGRLPSTVLLAVQAMVIGERGLLSV